VTTSEVQPHFDVDEVDIENVEVAFEDEIADDPHGLPEAKKDTWFTYYCKITSGLCPS
jgi:hypothetical protein